VRLQRSLGILPKMEAEINILSFIEVVKRILSFLEVFLAKALFLIIYEFIGGKCYFIQKTVTFLLLT
jgi:hypothetical protein